MSRYSSNDIVEVGRLTSGTSAQYIGINTRTGKKGIYKQNGCVLGIDNDDIREKMSSDILTSLNIDCASIDLVYDEDSGQNSYFSNYIIEENEELVAPGTLGCESDSQNPIDNMCERYLQGIRKLTNDEQLIEDARKNFYRYTYMCSILDCYDIKPDNLPVVYNKETNSYSIAPWFDFGTAFCPEHKSTPIYDMHTDEIMGSLFTNHYGDIKDLVQKVNGELTPERINEIFSNPDVVETLDANERQNIAARLMSQVEKSREMEMSKEQVYEEERKGIKAFLRNIKDRFSSLFNKGKNSKLLATGVEYEDKEKLAELGYTSVAEMNADDPDAKAYADKMADFLQENKYPPEDVIAYDQDYKESQGIAGQDLTIE